MTASLIRERLSVNDTDRILNLTKKLDLNSFSELLNPDSKVLALKVSKYFPEDLCVQFNERLLAQENELFSFYSHLPKSSLVTKLGPTFAEACCIPTLMNLYFEQAPKADTFIREFFFPYLSPIDRVRLDLDTLWPHGAVIGRMYGQKMRSGFIRNTLVNGDIVLHQDDLIEETPGAMDFQPKVELVNNVYLSVPPAGEGGELEIYDCSPNYANQLHELYDPTKESIEALVPASVVKSLALQPSVIVKPEVGDLILFKSRCVHRVHKVESGSRITSCFHIAYIDESEPLRCWI